MDPPRAAGECRCRVSDRRRPRWARLLLVVGVVVVVLGGGGAFAANQIASHYANEVHKNNFLAGVPQNERASETAGRVRPGGRGRIEHVSSWLRQRRQFAAKTQA